MAKLTDEQRMKYSPFFQGLWGLLKMYGNPEPGDKYWNALIRDCTTLSNGYPGDEIVLCLCTGLCEGLEKIQMSREGRNELHD